MKESGGRSAASVWILRHSVWLVNRHLRHRGGATSFDRLTGSPYRSPILPLFCDGRVLVPSDRTLEEFSYLRKEHRKHSDQCVVGRAEESDEHIVFSTTMRGKRGPEVVKLTAATWKSKRGGLRRRVAQRVRQHTETNALCDVKHVDTSIV